MANSTEAISMSNELATGARVLTIDVRVAFERWARWRVSGAPLTVGSSNATLTGRLLDGLRSTLCPDCKGARRIEGKRVGLNVEWIDPCPRCCGEGRIKGDLRPNEDHTTVACTACVVIFDGKPKSTGEINGRTCHKCCGSGTRVIAQLEVNPAGIRGTRYHGANEDVDPISALLDRTVAAWSQTNLTFWLYRVVIVEYCEWGTQEEKALDMRVSRRWYLKNLATAHQRAQEVLKTPN